MTNDRPERPTNQRSNRNHRRHRPNRGPARPDGRPDSGQQRPPNQAQQTQHVRDGAPRQDRNQDRNQDRSRDNRQNQGIRPPRDERSRPRRFDRNPRHQQDTNIRRPDHRRGNHDSNQQQSQGGVSGLFRRYDELLQDYHRSRKQYFELFGRADQNQKRKLERRYYDSIFNLRRWEASLSGQQKEFLEKRTNPYPTDTLYSSTHPEQTTERPPMVQGDTADPHYRQSQLEAKLQYMNDSEEGLGNEEDYREYKIHSGANN